MHAKNGAPRPPKDNLFRAVYPGVELRADSEAGGPMMHGHFAVKDQWTEINSAFEGHFLERFAHNAFTKTIKENGDDMRVLFQHGMDYVAGDKPLGVIRDLREDDTGAYYEVELLDAPYVRDEILPGLRAGLYGASFRFRSIREEFVHDPKPSPHNPDGLPERTIKEAQVMEFGPVTFPAYKSATAGVRSVSDEFLYARLARDPEHLRHLTDFLSARAEKEAPPAPSDPDAGHEATSDPERRDPPKSSQPLFGTTPKEERPPWQL